MAVASDAAVALVSRETVVYRKHIMNYIRVYIITYMEIRIDFVFDKTAHFRNELLPMN